MIDEKWGNWLVKKNFNTDYAFLLDHALNDYPLGEMVGVAVVLNTALLQIMVKLLIIRGQIKELIVKIMQILTKLH